MNKDQINAKLTRLAGKEQCTNKYCATKNTDYTRSFDACVHVLDLVGFSVVDCDSTDGWTWSIHDGSNVHHGYSLYPVYALALAIAEIPEG